VIDYQTFHQIRQLHDQEHLSVGQIAAAIPLDERTVSKWIERKTYAPRAQPKRASKLDPYKGTVVRLAVERIAIALGKAPEVVQRLRQEAVELNLLGEIFAQA
jgi:hypothetical protein